MQDPELERWDDVRLFLATYRAGSLGLAASRLGVDPSTVSRRVAALERQLGVTLFERTREGLLRTRAAEKAFEAAEAMEAANARLSREASDVETTAEGTVRLTLDPGLSEFFVAPMLARFRAKHPRLALELDATSIPRDLARREADLALRSSTLTGAELVATKLLSSSWVPVGAPRLVAKLGMLSSWDHAPWITWDRDLATYPAAQWLTRHAPKADLALRTNHFASQIAAAESGLGLALLPAPYVRRRKLAPVRATKRLAAAAQPWPTTDLWLVGHRVLRDLPRVAAVWRFLAEELRALAE